MANTMLLSDADRAAVIDGIRLVSRGVFRGYAPGPIELTETFEVWRFEGIVTTPEVPFHSRVRFDRRYHHQIRVNGRASAHAITTHADGENAPWHVMRLGSSALAGEIDATLDRLEEAAPGDATVVRLLYAPEYVLTAFWLVEPGNERLWVIGCPPYLRLIPRREFLSPSAFVAALAREQTEGEPARPR